MCYINLHGHAKNWKLFIFFFKCGLVLPSLKLAIRY